MKTENKAVTGEGTAPRVTDAQVRKAMAKRGGRNALADFEVSAASEAPEPSRNAGPTPKEYGDRWQPLRDRLTIREAQFLNTYTKTGDIAALNALVLQIIAERDRLREQVKELLEAAKLARDVLKAKGGATANERNHAYLNLGYAIASVDSSRGEAPLSGAKQEGGAS